MKPRPAAWRALAVATVLVAIAFALPRFLTHTPYQRLGASMSRGGEVERIVGPPAEGLLRPGDVLISVEGLMIADSVQRAELRAKGWPRETFVLVFERRGVLHTVDVPPVQLGAWQRLRLYTYPIIAVIAAPLVAFLLVWRRPDLPTAWVFLWFATLEGLSVIYSLYQFPQVEPGRWFQMYLRVYEWMGWLYPASFVHFMSVFPRPRWSAGRRVRSPWFWVTVLAYTTPVVLFVALRGWEQPLGDRVYNWYQAAAFLLGIGSLIERYSRTGPDWSPTTTQRVLALLVAFALFVGASLNVLAADPRFQALLPVQGQQVLFTIILIAWLSSPFLIAYLIADDPMFDPRRLIIGGLPYALLSGILAMLYLAVVFTGQRFFARVTGEHTLLFNVVAALVLAFAFEPIRRNVQRTIDRIYGRDPEALRRALDDAGRELLSALDRREVAAAVEQGLERGLRHKVALRWPDQGEPSVVHREEIPEHARSAVQPLLRQAGIRLENLALAEQRAAAERRAVEMREAATLAELRALQSQVQPHFLFNALNALAYLIETDPMAASRFTGRLADMLRYAVEAGKRPAALLSDEIAFVEDYLGVARERYENPLHFKFRGDHGMLSTSVPPLVLQPLVENSLKHGISAGHASLRMTLDARIRNGWFELEFADDGAANGQGAPGLGVGLENLEQRVRWFAGTEACVSSGRREEGGFVVRMRWPVMNGGAA